MRLMKISKFSSVSNILILVNSAPAPKRLPLIVNTLMLLKKASQSLIFWSSHLIHAKPSVRKKKTNQIFLLRQINLKTLILSCCRYLDMFLRVLWRTRRIGGRTEEGCTALMCPRPDATSATCQPTCADQSERIGRPPQDLEAHSHLRWPWES